MSMRTAAASPMAQHNVLVVLNKYFQRLTAKNPSQENGIPKNELQRNVYTYSILRYLSLHKVHINYSGKTSAIVAKKFPSSRVYITDIGNLPH